MGNEVPGCAWLGHDGYEPTTEGEMIDFWDYVSGMGGRRMISCVLGGGTR
jgi:hypothetical protein